MSIFAAIRRLKSLTQLKPLFGPAGSVTAGDASGINDGAAALADLHSKPEVQFSEARGTIAEDRSHFTLWSFAPVGDPAYPSAVKRTAMKEGSGISMQIVQLHSACDRLVRDFQELNWHLRDSFKSQ
jgi:hypothetical protein